jgi:hypothetical protein
VTVDDVKPLSLLALGTFIDAYGEGVLQAHEQTEAQSQDAQQEEKSTP